MPAVVVTGPRQVGKSNLAKQLAVTDRPYYTLDSLDLLDQARRDPDALVSSPPLIFDEIQRAPELTLAIKRRAGDFLLTGSARLPLLKGVADSLAGRAVYFNLPPFCPREWVEHPDALAPLDALLSGDFTLSDWPTTDQSRSEVWMSWLLRGGLPPSLQLASDQERDVWFSGYAQTYLERDLRDLSAVASLPDFQRVMRLAAHRTARLLNQSELARDAAIPQPTCHRYLGFAKTAPQNLELIRALGRFRALGRPVLAGPSRKSFIGQLLDEPNPQRRQWGTAAAVAACVLHGADILRVHDVPEMLQVCRVAAACR